MKTGDQIRARDDKLLKNDKSWRRARVGAILFAAVWVICFFALEKTDSDFEAEKNAYLIWLAFWIVVIDWLNLRISHIESIKYYRNRNS